MNRRIFALPALLATLLLASGCPDQPPIVGPESADHYEASLEALEGYGKPAWPQESVIRVLPEGTDQEFRIPFAGSLSLDGSIASFRADHFGDYGKACLALWPEDLTVVRDGSNLKVGLPQISMHSAYETVGTKDLEALTRAVRALYEARFRFEGEEFVFF